MSNILYCYGSGGYLYNIFMGIAIISKYSHGFLKITASIGLFYVILRAIFSGQRDLITPQLKWLAQYTVLTAFLLFNTQSIAIKDLTQGLRIQKVDGVPVALALPATFISTLGYALTDAYEQAFSMVNDLEYQKHGLVFGSKMISDIANAKIQNPILNENMKNFVDQCVVINLMLGTKYTIRELKKTEDIWDLVSKNASPLHMMGFRYEDGSKKNLTCKAAALEMNKFWSNESNQWLSKYSKRASKQNSDVLKTALKNVYSHNFGRLGGESAASILRQQLMINALSDVPKSYAGVRAAQQQKAAWMTTGELARESLPIMKGIFEAILYASFLLIMPLIVLPAGWRILSKYIGMLFWLQLWAPLYAVLNSIMVMYAKTRMGGVEGAGLTMQNMLSVNDIHSQTAALAGYLSASIPFISYAIIQGGAGSFVHLAGSISSATQSASASAASEVASGNYSFDNRSIDTLQTANSTAFQNNQTLRSTHGSEMQLSDGTMEHVTPDGNSFYVGGAGRTMGMGATKVNLRDDLQSQLHHSSTEAWRAGQSEVTSYLDKEAHTLNKLDSLAQREGYADGKSLAKIHQGKYGGHVSGQVGISMPGLSLFNAGAGFNAHATKEMINDESFRKDHNISDEEAANLSKDLNQLISLDNSIAANYEKSMMYQKAENLVQTSGGAFDYDTRQEFTEYVMKERNISALDAHKYVDSMEAKDMWGGFVQSKSEQIAESTKLGSADNVEDIRKGHEMDKMSPEVKYEFEKYDISNKQTQEFHRMQERHQQARVGRKDKVKNSMSGLEQGKKDYQGDVEKKSNANKDPLGGPVE